MAHGLVERILADSRVNKWFAHAAASPESIAAYKAKLADFLCQSTQGPCRYAGLDMTAAHKGPGTTASIRRRGLLDKLQRKERCARAVRAVENRDRQR